MATNLRLLNPQNPIPNGINQPNADPSSWAALQGYNTVQGDPHYRRMHLLNGRLGGPGNDTDNLAPGSASLNSNHFHNFEGPAMNELHAGHTITRYEVWIDYNQPGNPNLNSPAAQTAWADTITEIWGQFDYVDPVNGPQQGVYNAEEDMPGLDTQPNWAGN